MTALAIGLALAVLVALTAIALWARQRTVANELRERLRQQPAPPAVDPSRDTFLDLVTHELRSPLSAIIGYQELMSDGIYGQIGDGALEPLDRIGRSAQHLLHLLDGIMDLALLRDGPLSANLDSVDLAPLARAAARDFRAYADERQLRHSVHLDDDLPRIRSDHERLLRAMHLLVVAAIKSPAGDRVELRVERSPRGATFIIRGTRLMIRAEPRQPDHEDRIRVAVAAATADLLGGDLRSSPAEDGAAPQVVFVIRDTESAQRSP